MSSALGLKVPGSRGNAGRQQELAQTHCTQPDGEVAISWSAGAIWLILMEGEDGDGSWGAARQPDPTEIAVLPESLTWHERFLMATCSAAGSPQTWVQLVIQPVQSLLPDGHVAWVTKRQLLGRATPAIFALASLATCQAS